jgi:hypothetical protein
MRESGEGDLSFPVPWASSPDTSLYGDFSVKRKTIYAAPFLILSVLAACG